MKNIWMLTCANLRKNKGQAVSISIVIMIAVALLSFGLIVLDDVGRFFDERAEYLNVPHFVVVEERYTSNNDRLEFIANFDGIVATEKQDVLAGLGGYYVGDITNVGAMIFADGTASKEMAPLSLIGDYLPLVGDAIYIPHFLFTAGHALGDTIILEFLGEELEFTVAGSTEELLFGRMESGNWRFYIPHERFNELSVQFPNNQYTLLLAQFADLDESQFLGATYNIEFFGTDYAIPTFGGVAFPLIMERERTGRINMATTIATLMTSFSAFILVAGMIVIRTRIIGSIEEGIVNLGTLKAIGYRSRQIIWSIALQFGILATIGSILGLGLSIILIPSSAVIFQPMLHLIWLPSINVLVAFLPILIFILLVILFAFLSARRINKLHPLIALRGGLANHNFKKNAVPLETRSGPLALLLSLKRLSQSKRQAFAFGLIVASLMGVTVAGLTLHYNTNVNSTAFMGMIGFEELPDVVFLIDGELGQASAERIANHPDVESMRGSEFVQQFISNTLILTTVMEDFATATTTVVEGRLPQHDNEIILATMALRAMDKGIGDWVTIRAGAIEYEFLVVGTFHDMNQGGLNAMLSFEAMRTLDPDFTFSQFEVLLTDGADVDLFIEELRLNEGEYLTNIVPVQEQMDVLLSSLGSTFMLVAIMVLSVSTVVVIFILHMIIKAEIMSQKRELGIQKALGFTIGQLMNQIAIGIIPTISIGIGVGAVIGYFIFNPINAFFFQIDASESNFIIPIPWIIIVGIAMVVLAYLVSMLIAWRIRKISAYALVTE